MTNSKELNDFIFFAFTYVIFFCINRFLNFILYKRTKTEESIIPFFWFLHVIGTAILLLILFFHTYENWKSSKSIERWFYGKNWIDKEEEEN